MKLSHEVNVRITILGLEWLEPLLARINWKLDKIMATEAELAAQLQDNTAQIQKIGTETRSLLDKVQQLLDQIASAQVSPELQAAADGVKAQLQVVDDLVPDNP